MARKTQRRVVGAAGAGLVILLGVGASKAAHILAIGVAYKAKMVCDGLFVSKRDAAAVLADLEVDDLAILRHISVSTDTAARSVTAMALAVIKRRAVYRDGLGCALALDGLTPPALPAVSVSHGPSDVTASVGGFATPRAAADVARAELQAVIDRAFSEPDPRRLRRTQAVVIVRQGQIVGERYADGIGADTPLPGWSMTKSVMNALAGILVGQGRLTLKGPLPMPAWHRPGDARGTITLDDLLRMSSGVSFDENMSNPLSDVMRMLLAVGDAATYATDKDLTAAPGTLWRYSSGTSNILARAMRNVFRDDAEYLTFPRRALFDRVGMVGAVLETDAAGTFVGSSYMYATARDWARFGLLYLRDGFWDGVRVLPDGWVAYTTSPAPADPAKRYGAHFWLQVPAEYRGRDDDPPDGTYHAAGHEAQFVTIVPSRDVVIVRLGHTRYSDAWNQSAFVREVLAALD